MTKAEQFQFLLSNISKFSHRNQQLSRKELNKSQRLCITLQQEGINIPIFEKYEDIKTFFTGKVGECAICNKPTLLKNRNLNNPFLKYCSKKCENVSISNRQRASNTCHKFDKKKWKKNLSISLKKAIAEGRFTPNITNSWCHSRREFEMNGKIYKVRSSWEEIFWKRNPRLKYEKIRIPYRDIEGNLHSYIVDFVDEENKILYEIKPLSREFVGSIKHRAATAWCEKNNYKFEIIDEHGVEN